MAAITAFLQKLETAMAAVAFAQANEPEWARQLMVRGKTANKKVLLGAHGTEVNPRFLQYAFNLCQRMDSSLEIVHVIPRAGEETPVQTEDEAPGQQVRPLTEQLARMGIHCHHLVEQGCFVEEIASYVMPRRDILCVVLCASAECGQRVKETFSRNKAAVLDKLPCPVVFYGEPLRVAG